MVQVLFIMSNIAFLKKYDIDLVQFSRDTSLHKLVNDQCQEEVFRALIHLFVSMTEALLVKQLEKQTKSAINEEEKKEIKCSE